jgi:CYTH domain-containing protein
MPKEIERKFLINHEKWKTLKKPNGEYYRQGYILTDPSKTIRVRITNSAAFLTIKGASVGATRLEYEYPIPESEASELLENFAVSELSKTRYKIKHGNHIWEVDVFSGENEGLLVAEIELSGEEESFDIPEWISVEVTGEAKFYNSSLTLNPFKNWE